MKNYFLNDKSASSFKQLLLTNVERATERKKNIVGVKINHWPVEALWFWKKVQIFFYYGKEKLYSK